MRYPQGGLTADERADREQVRQATADWISEGATDREVAARFRGTGCRPTAGATRWPPAVARHWRRREPVGAHCQLSPAQLDELQVLLDAGPAAEGWADQCWTLARIAALVRTRFGVTTPCPAWICCCTAWGGACRCPRSERPSATRSRSPPGARRPGRR